MSDPHIICGVHVTDRVKKAGMVQQIFTQFGSCIRTRLGLHDVHERYSSPSGMIVLELVGAPAMIRKLERKLKSVRGLQVKKIEFGH
jgi:hypothetical protein